MVCELVGRLGRLWTNVGRMACFIVSVCLKVTNFWRHPGVEVDHVASSPGNYTKKSAYSEYKRGE